MTPEQEEALRLWEEQEDVPLDELSAKEQARAELGQRLERVYFQSSDQLLDSAKLEPDWLIQGAVPKGSISFLVGKPGSTKSWLAYDLAVCCVQDRDWLNFGRPLLDSNRDSRSALILNFDNPHHECARRFLRLGLERGTNLFTHSFGAHTPPEPFPQILQLPTAFDVLDAYVYYRRPNLIVVDSLRQAHTSDESSSQEMALIMSQLKRLALMGAAVVIVHHSRKNDSQMRGTTEIEASADSITDVEREAEVSLVTWRKTRGWEMPEPTVSVTLVDEGDRTFVRGGLSLTALLAQRGPMRRADIATSLQMSQAATKKLVEKSLDAGKVVESRDGRGGRLVGLPGKEQEDGVV